jgi:hypothetical protein
MNWLTNFPDSKTLLERFPEITVLNVNAHVHTPYSFSAFRDIPQIFGMAKKENIAAIGINDFFVSDGYEPFHDEALKNGIFPMFNIEFIGLLKKEQQSNIRVNDPNNPGRCYFCGKGLDYPFQVDPGTAEKLNRIISLSQDQVRTMISRANDLFESLHSAIRLDYDDIKSRLARNLVRERHLAKAIRIRIFEEFTTADLRIGFITRMFEGRTPKSGISDIPELENEIRSNLLKSGGKAFVEEDEDTFLGIDEIIEIIQIAGGIPCYPVLLDDRDGNYTEYERSARDLCTALRSRNIGCIELIPGRNDVSHLEKFVRFFYDQGFVILMGTEHNTPDLAPLTCNTRDKMPLSRRMRQVSYQGACVIAAHQYLRSRGSKGFISETGIAREEERKYLIKLGNAIIHYQQ